MSNDSVAKAYIAEMEELIVSVLGEKSPQEIAEFAGVSIAKATDLSMVREMVKLNHLLSIRRHQVHEVNPRVGELKPFPSKASFTTRMVANG